MNPLNNSCTWIIFFEKLGNSFEKLGNTMKKLYTFLKIEGTLYIFSIIVVKRNEKIIKQK